MTIQEASECDQISMEVLRSGRPRPGALNLILTLRDIGFTRRGDGGAYMRLRLRGGDTGRRAGGYSHP